MSHDDVTHHLPAYTDWLRSWGAADSTIKVRLSVLSRVLVEVEQTPDALGRWIGSYASAWTKSTYYAHLASFYDWAHGTGRVPVNPVARMRRPKSGRTLPRPLTDAQVREVLDAATGRTRAYVHLGLLAGLRAHEVAKIAGEDVGQESIYVLGKGAQSAYVPTHPDLWELAQEYPRRGWWFPSPRLEGQSVTPSAVSIAVGKLFRELGIEGSHHRLRHTYGTRLLRSGANVRVVQTLMRHESLISTQVYTAVTDDERAAAIRRMTLRAA